MIVIKGKKIKTDVIYVYLIPYKRQSEYVRKIMNLKKIHFLTGYRYSTRKESWGN